MHLLQKVLRQAGHPSQAIDFADGTRLLVLPHGGRVLGLFAARSSANFLWTHPALASSRTARRLFTAMRWPNPGGDRTWLAPASELFVSDLNRIWQTYREPIALDPGQYRWNKRSGVLELVNRARLKLFRSGGSARVEISKSFGPAPNPLRYERGVSAQVSYAGYTTSVSLRIISNPKRVRIGLWPLLQLPPGGEMLMPTFHRARPITLFGRVPSADLHMTSQLVRYRMRSSTTAKIAIRAVATTGRMGYVRAVGAGQCELVIRNFTVNPSGEYVDTPFEDSADLGYAVQACNIADRSLGSFSELEHHVPAVEKSRSTDVSQVWAFRGAPASIQKVIRHLLTPSHFVFNLKSNHKTKMSRIPNA